MAQERECARACAALGSSRCKLTYLLTSSSTGGVGRGTFSGGRHVFYLPENNRPHAEAKPTHVEPLECAPGDRQASVRLGTRVQSQLTDTPPCFGSFGCCGTITALMLSEARRRQAQRYALIGQATEDFDEVPSLDPARLPAAHARSPGRRTLWMWKLRETRRGRKRMTTMMGWTCRDYRRHLLCSHRHLFCSHRSLPCSRRSLLCSHRSLSRRPSRLQRQPWRCVRPSPAPARPQPASRHRPTDAAIAPAMAAGPARLHAASDAIGGHSRHDDERELGGRDGVGDTGVRPAHRTARHAQQCARRGLEAEHGGRARAAPLQDVVKQKRQETSLMHVWVFLLLLG